jgi:phosphoribosyl 1,2-cyclic phosphate phosphodiesterase
VGALLESDDGARLLIDTPPELRLQLITANIHHVDAVLYTHEHADHIHGIDDMRALSARHGALPIYGRPSTLDALAARFPYIFDAAVLVPAGTFKPNLTPTPLEAGREVAVAGVSVVPVEVGHGEMPVYGYRFTDLAYVTDVKTIPDATREHLLGVRVLVISALLERPHPTHLSIPEAVAFAQSVGAERTILTHLTHKYTHGELLERLPEGVEPAYDGLVVSF